MRVRWRVRVGVRVRVRVGVGVRVRVGVRVVAGLACVAADRACCRAGARDGVALAPGGPLARLAYTWVVTRPGLGAASACLRALGPSRPLAVLFTDTTLTVAPRFLESLARGGCAPDPSLVQSVHLVTAPRPQTHVTGRGAAHPLHAPLRRRSDAPPSLARACSGRGA